MDHDFLKVSIITLTFITVCLLTIQSNDFAGEAFLDLSEVPGFGHLQGAAGGLKQFNLVLTHPSSRGTVQYIIKFPH
jgi:hypothetical protein